MSDRNAQVPTVGVPLFLRVREKLLKLGEELSGAAVALFVRLASDQYQQAPIGFGFPFGRVHVPRATTKTLRNQGQGAMMNCGRNCETRLEARGESLVRSPRSRVAGLFKQDAVFLPFRADENGCAGPRSSRSGVRCLGLALAALALTGCTTTRWATAYCLTPPQYQKLKDAEPGKVGSKLDGNAQDDLKTIAGSAIELRSYSDGLLGVLQGCVDPNAGAAAKTQ